MRAALLKALDALAASIAARPDGLCLLGLGSCGDHDRLDDHSDLDFFVMVAPGSAGRWRDHLDWLDAIGPISFAHRNTADGWKVLFEDGVFCEFAVFEPEQLAHIPFAAGRVLWAREGFDQACLAPRHLPGPPDRAWHAKEALTNLLIGLKRLDRGEQFSAWQFICQHGLINLLRALDLPSGDPFDPLRRLETRAPDLARALRPCLDGHDLKGASLVMVSLLREHGFAPDPIAAAIEALARAPVTDGSPSA